MANRYDAFISYSQAHDGAFAPALRVALERLGKPWYSLRRLRVFLDAAHLTAATSLSAALKEALASSEWLILLASAESAQSSWVNWEVEWWLENQSPDRMLIAGTSVGLTWDGQRGDWAPDAPVPQALRQRSLPEPHVVDLSADHGVDRWQDLPAEKVAQLAAPLRNVSKEALISEERRQHRRFMRAVAAAVVVLVVSTTVAVAAGVIAEAQAHAARSQRDLAVSNELTVESGNLMTANPVLSRLLGAAASRIDATPQARVGMLQAAAQPGVASMPGQDTPVDSIAYSHDGRMLAVGYNNGAIGLFELRSYRLSGSFIYSAGPVEDLAFSLDNRTLVSVGYPPTLDSSDPSTVQRWDVATHRLLGQTVTAAYITTAISPDGRVLAVVNDDTSAPGPIRLVDLITGHVMGRVADAPGGCDAIAFSPDEQVMAAHCGSKLDFWAIATGRVLGTPVADPTATQSLVFSPDGQHLASAGPGSQVQLWDVATRRPAGAAFSTDLTIPAQSVAFAPDGLTLATGGRDGVARLWRVTVTAPAWAAAPHAVYALAYSADGKTLAAGTASGTIYQLSTATGRQDGAPVTDPAGPVTALAYRGSDLVIDAGQGSTDVQSWDPRTGRAADPPVVKGGYTLPTAGISSDGRLFAAGSFGRVEVGSTRTGDLAGPALNVPFELVSALAFSRDDRELAMEGDEYSVEYVQIWNLVGRPRPTGPEIAVGSPIAEIGQLSAIALSPDGHTLAVADSAGKVELWDLVSGHQLGASENLGPGTALAFSPDGGTLVIGGADGTIRLLDVRFLTDPAAALCAAAARSLSAREWTEYAAGIPYQPICR